MFESLINPKKAERKPWELLLIGLIYGAIAIGITDFIFLNNLAFSKYSSILIITFIVMLCTPFMYYTIKYEEKKDTKCASDKKCIVKGERKILKEHGKAIASFIFLFFGIFLAFTLFYMVLPEDVVAKNFNAQLTAYCHVNMPRNVEKCVENKGLFLSSAIKTSMEDKLERLGKIFINNFWVLIFCLGFSFLFGSGAIFILTWNASVIATATGIFTKSIFLHLPSGLLRYMIHGIPEITAYFIAALAGGIISIAVIRHDYKDKKFWFVLEDSIDLIILALVVLLIAGIIEVFVTPLFFT